MRGLSKIRGKKISELRDTPPEFITSLFNSKSSSGSYLCCLSLNIKISESLTIRGFRSEYQSRASDQNIRASVFSELESILVPVDLSKNRKHSSISELECLRLFVSVIRYEKYHSCSPPFCQQSKSVSDVLKQLKIRKTCHIKRFRIKQNILKQYNR